MSFNEFTLECLVCLELLSYPERLPVVIHDFYRHSSFVCQNCACSLSLCPLCRLPVMKSESKSQSSNGSNISSQVASSSSSKSSSSSSFNQLFPVFEQLAEILKFRKQTSDDKKKYRRQRKRASVIAKEDLQNLVEKFDVWVQKAVSGRKERRILCQLQASMALQSILEHTKTMSLQLQSELAQCHEWMLEIIKKHRIQPGTIRAEDFSLACCIAAVNYENGTTGQTNCQSNGELALSLYQRSLNCISEQRNAFGERLEFTAEPIIQMKFGRFLTTISDKNSDFVATADQRKMYRQQGLDLLRKSVSQNEVCYRLPALEQLIKFFYIENTEDGDSEALPYFGMVLKMLKVLIKSGVIERSAYGSEILIQQPSFFFFGINMADRYRYDSHASDLKTLIGMSLEQVLSIGAKLGVRYCLLQMFRRSRLASSKLPSRPSPENNENVNDASQTGTFEILKSLMAAPIHPTALVFVVHMFLNGKCSLEFESTKVESEQKESEDDDCESESQHSSADTEQKESDQKDQDDQDQEQKPDDCCRFASGSPDECICPQCCHSNLLSQNEWRSIHNLFPIDTYIIPHLKQYIATDIKNSVHLDLILAKRQILFTIGKYLLSKLDKSTNTPDADRTKALEYLKQSAQLCHKGAVALLKDFS